MHKIQEEIMDDNNDIQILVDQSKAREFCMIHNNVFDHLMKSLKATEFTVFMVAIRKIHGFDKQTDKISISQFTEYTGLSNRTVCNSLKVLIERGLLVKVSTDFKKGNEYSLNSYAKKSQPIVKLCKKVIAPMQESHTQETHLNTHDEPTKDTPKEKSKDFPDEFTKLFEEINKTSGKNYRVLDNYYKLYKKALKTFEHEEIRKSVLYYLSMDCFNNTDKSKNYAIALKTPLSIEKIDQYSQMFKETKSDGKNYSMSEYHFNIGWLSREEKKGMNESNLSIDEYVNKCLEERTKKGEIWANSKKQI